MKPTLNGEVIEMKEESLREVDKLAVTGSFF
jgi:hypothetical protein